MANKRPSAIRKYQEAIAGGISYSFAPSVVRNKKNGPAIFFYAWRGSPGEGVALGIVRYSLPLSFNLPKGWGFSENPHGELIGKGSSLKRRMSKAGAVPLTERVGNGHRPVVMIAGGDVLVLPSVTSVTEKRLRNPVSLYSV